MKIAMIGQKRVPSREGGVEIVVEKLATLMAAMGHNVTVYNRRGRNPSGEASDGGRTGRRSEYHGIHIITVPTVNRKGLAAISSSFFATCMAVGRHFDVIHYHAEGPSAMLIFPHLLGIHTVSTIHGLDWQRAKWGKFAAGYLKFGEKIAAKYADEVIVLSRSAQQYFLETYSRKTVFIPNGVSEPALITTELIRRKWGLEKDGYFLYVGRIVPEKGIRCLINAFHGVHTEKRLVIAGGSSDSARYMREVQALAGEDHRILFTDFVQGTLLEELFSNAYVYVLPSELEGMPISLLEAMSYGNCCVVSEIPECGEVVGDKAILFRKGDEAELAAILKRLCDHPSLTQRYKQSAADYILKKYSWMDAAEKTLQIYDSIAGGGR